MARLRLAGGLWGGGSPPINPRGGCRGGGASPTAKEVTWPRAAAREERATQFARDTLVYLKLDKARARHF